MTHDVIHGIDRYSADEGKGFIGKNESGIVQSTELWLCGTASIDDYLELPLGTEYNMEATEADKDAALRGFGVEV